MDTPIPAQPLSPAQPVPAAPPASPVIDTEFEQVTKSVKFPKNFNYKRFNALFVLPKEKSYENLEVDEKVLFFIYKHPITLLKKVVVGVILSIVLIVGLIISMILVKDPFFVRVGIAILWYLGCFMLLYTLIMLVTYRTDAYIITNERIIDLDVFNLLSKHVEDINIEAIHAIKQDPGKGIFKGQFDYGNVVVEHLGGTFTLENIPMPSKVALALGELVEEREKEGKEVEPEPVINNTAK